MLRLWCKKAFHENLKGSINLTGIRILECLLPKIHTNQKSTFFFFNIAEWNFALCVYET